MKLLEKLRRLPHWLQMLICAFTIGLTAFAGHFILHFVDYQAIAFLLLFVLSLIAAIFDRWAVLLATLIAAFSWNFFFIPPRFDFHIASDTDLLIFLTFFMITFFNLVLSARLRELDRKKREEIEHEQAIQLFNTILQTLSHELRTPISGILGSLETLDELKEKLSVEQIAGLTKNMHSSALRLNDQVNKLLNMSRLEAGALKVHKDWIDVEDLISSFLAKHAEVWEQRKIETAVQEEMPLCKIDSALIEPVIFNLIQNAHLYSPSHGKIIVSAQTREEELILTVADDGKGIPENSAGQLFSKFYRLPDSLAGGTGLGLSIVKGFAEVHGGKVSAFNSEKGGAVFEVKIPCEMSWIKSLKHE